MTERYARVPERPVIPIPSPCGPRSPKRQGIARRLWNNPTVLLVLIVALATVAVLVAVEKRTNAPAGAAGTTVTGSAPAWIATGGPLSTLVVPASAPTTTNPQISGRTAPGPAVRPSAPPATAPAPIRTPTAPVVATPQPAPPRQPVATVPPQTTTTLPAPPTEAVPNVVGLSAQQATDLLTRNGFAYYPLPRSCVNGAAPDGTGIVTVESPAAGTRVLVSPTPGITLTC